MNGILKNYVSLSAICILLCLSSGAQDYFSVGKKLSELLLTTDPENYDPEGYSDQDMKSYNGHYGRGEYVHYSVVSYWVNCLEFSRLSGDKKMENELIAKFEPFLSTKKHLCNGDDHVDRAVFGAVPLEIYILTGNEKYLELGLKYADAQWSKPDSLVNTASANKCYEDQLRFWEEGYSPQTRLWIDDMYMINLLQTQAYRATGDTKYIYRAAKEMALYLDSIQKEDGMFFHAEGKEFVWGRGNGWMAAGMPMILKYLPKDNEFYDRILQGYRKMMHALLVYQREDGLWGQLVDDPDSWSETSGSAMFTYGINEGLRYGLLDESEYRPAVVKAWKALCSKLDGNGFLRGVCVGTGAKSDRQWYIDRPVITGDPHGQAPIMWICNSMFPVVFLIGDSTCANYKLSRRPRYGWGEKLQPYLAGVRVENHATSGRSTKSFISEGRWDVVMSRLRKGDYVFIQFGHNDEKLNDPKRGTEPFGEYYDNLCRFISDTRSKGATPVLLTPICRRKFNNDQKVVLTHKDYPAAMKKAGKDTKTIVLDMESSTADWLQKLGRENSANYFMYSADGKDNTHLVSAGAEAVSLMVADQLRKYFPKIVSVTKHH